MNLRKACYLGYPKSYIGHWVVDKPEAEIQELSLKGLGRAPLEETTNCS